MKRARLFIVLLSGLSAAHPTNTTRYHLVTKLKSWLGAEHFCRDHYVGLAAVHSQDENEQLRRLLSKAKARNAWIGLYDDLTKWKWVLVTTRFDNNRDYNFWAPRNPTRATLNQSCVVVTNKGYWKDTDCNLAFPAVCYSETGPTKYVLVNEPRTFQKAKTYCRSFHSRLASIRNQMEQDTIARLVTNETWIGLNRRRYHLWSNLEGVTFTNWNETQPELRNAIKQRCILVSKSTGKWLEEACSQKHYFVCEKPPRVHQLKLKMKFQSSTDMNDPAVIGQIQEQILAKVKNATSSLQHKVNWVAANNQVFCKEKKDQWEQSGRC